MIDIFQIDYPFYDASILQNPETVNKDFRKFYIFYVMLLELQNIPDGVRQNYDEHAL
ncbi:hypothetical protein FC13_GL001084 [Lacticaseibacillus casei DSM 20011 = JCM 1134 = ATCC 393]|nr:hypothetical protein FC13_GL001084 [Lacticaseibacillus casei DSM 20011 = JCM 1134 = ATCC 393]